MSTALDEVRRRRTFAIISHPDAGKTTLTEKLLLFSGAIQIAGSVKARKASRHATSDWMEIEKQRGISVASSVMQMVYRDHVINLLDTPGHKDFSEDTYRVLTAVDSALMVIDAANGVEAQTRRLIEVCRQRHTPILTFVNKMDRAGADFLDVCKQVKEKLGSKAVPLQLPIGAEENFRGVVDLVNFRGVIWNEEDKGMTYQVVPIPEDMMEEAKEYRGKLLEAVAEYDESLIEKYFENPESITEGEIIAALRQATIGMAIVPMVCGSSFKNKGVQTMLDYVMELLPSPLDKDDIIATSVDTGADVTIKPDESEPFTALAFKIATDPFVGRLCFIRAYSGVLESGSYVYNSRSENKERISRVFQMHANKDRKSTRLNSSHT